MQHKGRTGIVTGSEPNHSSLSICSWAWGRFVAEGTSYPEYFLVCVALSCFAVDAGKVLRCIAVRRSP